MWIGIDVTDSSAAGGEMVRVCPNPLTCTAPQKVTGLPAGAATLDKNKDGSGNFIDHDDTVFVAWDAPVFEEFYNPLTDVQGCVLEDPNTPHKPSGLCEPTWVIPEDDPRHIPGGVDLGARIIIQVVDIYN